MRMWRFGSSRGDQTGRWHDAGNHNQLLFGAWISSGWCFPSAWQKTWMPGELSEQQVEQIMQEAQRPGSPLAVVTAEAAAPPSNAAAAEAAALALLKPFLKVPEVEAQAALAELLQSGPEEPHLSKSTDIDGQRRVRRER